MHARWGNCKVHFRGRRVQNVGNLGVGGDCGM